jgi:hypothetical protein
MKRFIRCQAATKSGNPCKNGAMHLTPFCGPHQGSPWGTVKQTRNTPVTVYIYNLWHPATDLWEAEILVDVGITKQLTKHIFGSTTATLTSIQDAYEWAYQWLNSNGYATSNIEFEANVPPVLT